MKVTKIYFDMDGVLADFENGVRTLCKIDAYSLNEKRPAGYDELLWEKVRGVEHFYDRLGILPGAKEMFDDVRTLYGDKCEILTGIPKPHKGVKTAAEDKTSWMRRLLSEDIVMNIVYRQDKLNYCKGSDYILIDDMKKTIDQWREMGGTGILHVSPEETMAELRRLGVFSYYDLGVSLKNSGRFEEAKKAFLKAAEEPETAGRAFCGLAGLSTLKQDFKTALEFADKAVAENCSEPDAYGLKMEILRELGKDTSAFIKETYDKKIVSAGVLFRTLDRDDFFAAVGEEPEAVLALLRFYAENGLFRSAVEVLGICPLDDPLIMYWEGHLHMVLGDMEGAAAIWKDAENTVKGSAFKANGSDIGILKEAVIVGEYVGEKMPVTSYRLGKLFNACGKGKEAVAEMEKAAAGRPDLAVIAADLSVVYYNYAHNAAKALDAIGRACALEPGNSLFLLRQDKLLERVGADPMVRFSLLEGKKDLLEERDELCLSYARLLNLNGRHEEALKLLSEHRFHPWESGVDKATTEYRNTLLALAAKKLMQGEPDKAAELCKETFELSVEGSAQTADGSDSKSRFMLGEIYRAIGDEETAKAEYQKAADSEIEPKSASSDSVYWTGLAKARLGLNKEALRAMKNLIDYGNAHMNDTFEAGSPVRTDDYEEDLKKINEDHCKRLVNLGVKGLAEVG